MKASSESGLWPSRTLRGAWVGTLAVYFPSAIPLWGEQPISKWRRKISVEEVYVRVAVQTIYGSVLLWGWSLLLFFVAVRTSLKSNRRPVTLVVYTLTLTAFMLSPLPVAAWTQTYLPFIAMLSAGGFILENWREDLKS